MPSLPTFALPSKPLPSASATAPNTTAVLSGGTRLGGLPSAPRSLPSKPSSHDSAPTSQGIRTSSIDIEMGARKVSNTVVAAETILLEAKAGFGGRNEGQPNGLEARRKESLAKLPSRPATPVIDSGIAPKPHKDAIKASSPTVLGKRKEKDKTPIPIPSAMIPSRSDRALSPFSVAPSTSTVDTKPLLPVPMLPLPLPSKRFKKSASSKAVLIPVEQLPVYPLPPPPPIRDAALAKQVFIHSSCFQKTRGRFEDAPEKPTEHYEKLEHVGDSILGMVVTAWLHEIKPGLSCGTASKLKAHLVSNATLSHISGMYNFPQRLQGDPHILPVLRAQTDVRAAMMEAYIAALYFSFPVEQRLGEGIRVIDTWLREMYEPLFDFFYDYMKSEYEQHHLTLSSTLSGASHLYTEDEIARIDTSSQGMANLLQMYCYRQDRELHFEEERYETHCGILWRLKCLVDGIEVGEATRSGRKVAKNVAAWEACKRLGLIKDEDNSEEDRAAGDELEIGGGDAGDETVVEEDPSE